MILGIRKEVEQAFKSIESFWRIAKENSTALIFGSAVEASDRMSQLLLTEVAAGRAPLAGPKLSHGDYIRDVLELSKQKGAEVHNQRNGGVDRMNYSVSWRLEDDQGKRTK